MKTLGVTLATVMVGSVALSVSSVAQGAPVPTPDYKFERCYGVAKAGKNDCRSILSCAGTATTDNDPNEYVYLPAGSCEKIVGGSLEPKKS